MCFVVYVFIVCCVWIGCVDVCVLVCGLWWLRVGCFVSACVSACVLRGWCDRCVMLLAVLSVSCGLRFVVIVVDGLVLSWCMVYVLVFRFRCWFGLLVPCL